MSRSPYFYLEYFNKKIGKYEVIAPLIWNWEHTEHIPADLFPYNGCHDVFSILSGREFEGDYCNGIHKGLPHDVTDEVKEVYEECKKYGAEPSWITYADLYIYCLEHPKVPDWDKRDIDEDSAAMMDNPIFTLKRRIDAFMDVCDYDLEDNRSSTRIVYWIL